MTQAETLLKKAGVAPTPHRAAVLTAVLEAGGATSAPELLHHLPGKMNKVTLYRILDLLTEHHVIERHAGPDRSARYCMGHGHAHFCCTRCGAMSCLTLDRGLDMAALSRAVGGRIDAVELRIDGVCAACLDRQNDAQQ